MRDSQKLLAEYVKHGSEAAFRILVDRYVDLVYSTARRQLENEPHLAEDATQIVFAELARKAALLRRESTLGGWLHCHTCFVCSDLRRREQRRRAREHLATAGNDVVETHEDPWRQAEPMLDAVINDLPEEDRRAILLRYFERESLKNIGAILNASEDAAQKRVSRALEKLRQSLSSRGITASIAGLAVGLDERLMIGTPIGLAERSAAMALGKAVSGIGVIAGILHSLAGAKLKALGIAALLAVALVPVAWMNSRHVTVPQTTATNAALKKSNNVAAAALPKAVRRGTTETSASVPESIAAEREFRRLTLQLLAGDTGTAVTNATVECRLEPSRKYSPIPYTTDANGNCEIPIPATTTSVEIYTRINGLSDTRLYWPAVRRIPVPAAYTLRLTRPQIIGGTVIGPEGKPVPKTKVVFGHKRMPPTASDLESHEFQTLTTATDAQGKWVLNRIAPEMLRYTWVEFAHPDYITKSSGIRLDNDRAMEEALKGQTHVFQLQSGATINGFVRNSEGSPVTNAVIVAGKFHGDFGPKANTRTDGAFRLSPLRPEIGTICVTAKGLVGRTFVVNFAKQKDPLAIVLHHGRTVRLRVVDEAGHPISKGWIIYDSAKASDSAPAGPELPSRMQFQAKANADGWVIWTNAPDGKLPFDIGAPGHMRIDDDLPIGQSEAVFVVPRQLVVSGTAVDAQSGAPIRQFRMRSGIPGSAAFTQATGIKANANWDACWADSERLSPMFANGVFRFSFREPAIGGIPKTVYVLKFEAEGYQSFTTRIIAADEGEAKFDVRLNHAQSKYLTVLRPDRQPAVLVNVSLVGKDSDFVRIVNGAVVYRWANGKVSMVTDTNGMAPFNVETEVTHVVVADPMGFSSQSFAEVEKNPRIRLQSWASVSGTIRNDPNVIEVKSVRIKSFWKTGKYALVEVPVDDNGSFNADFVPPGHLSVEPRPLVKVRDFNWPKAWPKAEVEIAPAATTNLVFNFLEFGAAATR